MITNAQLPTDLQQAVSGESVDFALRSSRHKPKAYTAGFLGFGSCWTLFTLFFIAVFFGPFLLFGELDITINGEPTHITENNIDELLIPAIFLGIFVIIGLVFLIHGITSAFARGGWYICLKDGLSYYRKGKTELTQWEEFNKAEAKDKDVILKLTTGGEIHITGIPDAKKIAEICQHHIDSAESAEDQNSASST